MKQNFSETSDSLFLARKNREVDSDTETRFLQYTVISVTGLLAMLAFGLYNFLAGRYLLCVMLLVAAVGLIWGWLLLYWGVAERMVYRVNAFMFLVLLLYITYIGGEDQSMLLWLDLFPLVMFFVFGRKEGMVWTVILWIASVVYLFGPFSLPGGHEYSLPLAIRFFVIFNFIAIFAFTYETFRQNYRQQMEEKHRLLSVEIGERERVERVLRESEERYRAIYHQAAEGIVLVNAKGDIVECNPQVLKMLSYDEEDLLGKNIFTFIESDNLKKIPSQLGRLLAGETVFVERKIRTGSGAYLHCEQSGRKINDDLIILLYRDITERKIAEIALEQANQALQRLAHIDGLTRIANRRKFDQVLTIEWQRMKREKKQLGLILGDIDFFKQYNDIYGHQSGDDCLKRVASALASAVHRPADLVARYGGEEFVVLLPDTDLPGTRKLAENMLRKVSSLQLPHAGSGPIKYVTVSLGIASVDPRHYSSEKEFIDLADQGLYRAKENGRNQISSVQETFFA